MLHTFKLTMNKSGYTIELTQIGATPAEAEARLRNFNLKDISADRYTLVLV